MKKGQEVFVGIDTAKTHNAVAVAEAGGDSEGRYLGAFENTLEAGSKLVRKLADRYEKLYFCYEAGPTGLALLWQNAGEGFPNRHFSDSWLIGCWGPIMAGRTRDWRDELESWLEPFLTRLDRAP